MDRLERIARHPGYRALVRRRRWLAWTLTATMGLAYYGYVLLIAFDKELLARPIAGGVTSLGIPIGFGLILLGIALTGVYVRIANRDYDARLKALLDEVGE